MTDTSAAGTGAEPLRVARLRPGALVAGLVAVLGAMVIGMALGPVDIAPKLIVYELLDDLPLIELDSGLSAQRVAIIEQIRLPRVVLGFLVGATLSVSGAAYQGAFRNPLADPYLLGIAAGAGLGAICALVNQCDAANTQDIDFAAGTTQLNRVGVGFYTATVLQLNRVKLQHLPKRLGGGHVGPVHVGSHRLDVAQTGIEIKRHV